MKSIRFAILMSLVCVGGCIVGDQLTTVTIHPDGSADLLVFRSNLHSTQKGEAGAKELAAYKANFATQVDDEFARLREAGGKAAEVSWIREQPPFSNLVRVHFADASAIEKFGTVKSDDGSVRVTTKFHRDGAHRKLAVHIAVPPDAQDSSESSPSDAGQLRQSLANGISETRIAVANGTITAARGFTVAGDKQSALVNVAEIAEGVRSGQGAAEFYLEWDVTP